jgi:hypothetical protein
MYRLPNFWSTKLWADYRFFGLSTFLARKKGTKDNKNTIKPNSDRFRPKAMIFEQGGG